MLKRILIGIALIGGIFLLFKFCDFKKNDEEHDITYNTNLIQQQILNVGKLVVTEGHFSEVITYKNQQKYLLDMVSFEKKALIIVNADVTVSYDLHLIKYDIDDVNKTITILYIPKEEIKISPNIQFYDVEQSKLNPFTGDDYNKINKSVKANLAKKIEKSSLKTNAQNRLISELSKILIVTKTMNWMLVYNGKEIEKESDLRTNLNK
jgi:lipopolysaccharide export LptBFGC system permease protein LptF